MSGSRVQKVTLILPSASIWPTSGEKVTTILCSLHVAVDLLVVLRALVGTAPQKLPEREALVALLQCLLDGARVDLERGRVDLEEGEAELRLRVGHADRRVIGPQQHRAVALLRLEEVAVIIFTRGAANSQPAQRLVNEALRRVAKVEGQGLRVAADVTLRNSSTVTPMV